MQKKQITKIELDGKIIGSKPLFNNDTLVSIREKIKEKVDVSYIFLDNDGNDINKEDENDYNLENICVDKTIKIKSTGEKKSGINIVLNESNISCENFSNSQTLDEIRKLLQNKINCDFVFLDQDGNKVDQNDEAEYKVEDILNKNSIKLEGNDSSSAPTSKESKKTQKESKEINNKPLKKKKKIDLSNYEEIEQKDEITIYKYSKIERQSNHKLIYEYFYDKYDPEDYHNAYVVLFCGKTGDGKTTSINAIFNIVKGIEIEDNYRFILITEPKKEKGQAESQTDGIHIYYLKDYNNKPIIIIDSQGYGDTRGLLYDQMINEAFAYVFSSVIDHINAAFFIVKSNTNRIDVSTKYIFSSVTSLFSEDISENFIVLATFANKETISKGPAFVESIQTDADFLNINKRMDDKWWYAIDSKCILDNEKDKLTLYSFKMAKELYEEKVKKLRSKGIKRCAEVLNTRMELKVQVDNLNETFKNLLIEQDNLQEKERIINETSGKIEMMTQQINFLENNMEQLKPKELEERMRRLNEELNDKINNLNNQTESKQIKKLKYSSDNKYTHCQSCEKNCHDPCDCSFKFLGRCTIYTFWAKKCEVCGCDKEQHQQDNYYYTYETVTIAKNTAQEKQKEKEKSEKEKKIIIEEMNKKNNAKNNLEKQKNEMKYNKDLLLKEKENNLKEKHDIQNKIKNINHQILFIIIKLQSISEKINDIAMNNNHIKNEDEYIDDLMDKMDKMNIKEKDKIEKIKKIKETNEIFKRSVKLDRNSLLKLGDSELAEKLKIIIPTNKKVQNPNEQNKEPNKEPNK